MGIKDSARSYRLWEYMNLQQILKIKLSNPHEANLS